MNEEGGDLMDKNCLKKVLTKDPNVVCRLIDGQRVIIPLRFDVDISELGAFYILKNASATHIWDRINGKRTVADIIASVVDRFQVSEERAKTDTMHFVKELADIKAIG
jgi:hypothetical protein